MFHSTVVCRYSICGSSARSRIWVHSRWTDA